LNDRAQWNGMRRAVDLVEALAENQRMQAEIEQLNSMIKLEQALRRNSEEKLAMYRRMAGQSLDAELDQSVNA
jgi:hypothetical protein